MNSGLKPYRGVAIFAQACFGHPSPSKRQKLNATAKAFSAADVVHTCHFATTIVNSALYSGTVSNLKLSPACITEY